MTIASAVSKVTLNGNGSTTSFPFGFKVWKAEDLEVSITDASGAVSIVTNWGVVLSPSGGGTVTYPLTGSPLPTGHKITIARSMDFLQDVDLVSGTRWDPEVVETALDRATAERQQLKERLDRAVAIPISSSTTPEQFADDLFSARDAAVSSAASAATSAATAQVAANSVGVLSASGTLTAGQDTITLPWSYDTGTGNIAVFLGGVKQLRSTLTFLTSTTVRVGAAVTEDTPYEVTSVTLPAESVLTGIRDQCVAAKTGAETARTGAEAAKAEAEAARAGAEAAKTGAETARAGAEAALAATTASIRNLRAGDIVMRGHTTIRTLDDGLPEALELNGDVVSLTTFPRLMRAWWGEEQNAAAPAFYRCNAAGVRDAAGTHFKLPDLRGYVPRGWDHGRGIDVGRILLSLQEDAIRNITGSFTVSDTNSVGATDGVGTLSGAYFKGSQHPKAAATITQLSYDVNFDASRVVPTAAENRMRNAALMFIIYV